MPERSVYQRRLKLKRPFRSEAQEAVVAMLRTTSSLRRGLQASLEDEGITLQQFNVLRILRGAGEPLPTMEVADRMVEQEPGITRLCNRMVAKGLVTRERDQQDQRIVRCRITDKGLDILTLVDGPLAEFEETFMANLTKEECRQLVALLARI